MKQALLIVDIQNDYFPGGKMALVGMEDAAKNAQRVLGLFRAGNLPIFHIQHVSNRAGATFFLPETDGVEIHERVTPKHGEYIIQKHFPNSFRDTSLNDQLQTLNVGEVIICGAMTHVCIDTTVRAAFDLGYRCLVVSDACATRNLQFGGIAIEAPQVHAAFMAALSSFFARVVETNNLESQLG
ncbi:MAG TPA: cysteine hydrolase family protein [Balneolales bacterium]|nr:cysteine hydrolase family protein [Balneolales bacterium]